MLNYYFSMSGRGYAGVMGGDMPIQNLFLHGSNDLAYFRDFQKIQNSVCEMFFTVVVMGTRVLHVYSTHIDTLFTI